MTERKLEDYTLANHLTPEEAALGLATATGAVLLDCHEVANIGRPTLQALVASYEIVMSIASQHDEIVSLMVRVSEMKK